MAAGAFLSLLLFLRMVSCLPSEEATADISGLEGVIKQHLRRHISSLAAKTNNGRADSIDHLRRLWGERSLAQTEGADGTSDAVDEVRKLWEANTTDTANGTNMSNMSGTACQCDNGECDANGTACASCNEGYLIESDDLGQRWCEEVMVAASTTPGMQETTIETTTEMRETTIETTIGIQETPSPAPAPAPKPKGDDLDDLGDAVAKAPPRAALTRLGALAVLAAAARAS